MREYRPIPIPENEAAVINAKSVSILMEFIRHIQRGERCIMFGPGYVVMSGELYNMSKELYNKVRKEVMATMAKAIPKPKRKPATKPAPKKPKK